MTTKFNILLFLIFGLVSLVASTCDLSTGICYSSGISCPSQGNTLSINGRNYYLADIDVISFNDLTINNGDIQNRAAVRNNFYATNGVSVADMLTDNCGFGLIVGGDLSFPTSGSIFPTNQSFFVGGSVVTGPSYLINQVVNCGTFGLSSGCISTYFDQLYSYWSQFSSSLSLLSNNVQVTYSDGVATLTCTASAPQYNIHIASNDFNQIIGYATSNCDASANWVFNLFGDVTFQGNPLQVSGSVVFNVGGSGTITVTSSVIGSIIAPNANINQVGGTIYGQVIAGNFSNVVQINTPNTCPVREVASRDVYSCTGASNTGSLSGSVPTPTPDPTPVPESSSTTGSVISNSGSDANNQPTANNDDQTAGTSTLVASFILPMIAIAFM